MFEAVVVGSSPAYLAPMAQHSAVTDWPRSLMIPETESSKLCFSVSDFRENWVRILVRMISRRFGADDKSLESRQLFSASPIFPVSLSLDRSRLEEIKW